MKKIINFIIFTLIFMVSANQSFAISTSKIDKLIYKSSMNETSTIAISIKNAKTGSLVYEQNSKKLLHPASTLKVFTAYVADSILGKDYKFKTQFYKDNENNLYIKLGADPLLTTKQLQQAFYDLKSKGNVSFNNLYFDDSIIDKKEFATGWMWDDEISPYTPKVSSYNLDGNLLTVKLFKNDNSSVAIDVKSTYPTSVISSVKTGVKDNLEIQRYGWNSPEVVEIIGTVENSASVQIPISSMRRYFIYNLNKIIEDTNIKVKNVLYSSNLVPENAELLGEIVNPIDEVIQEVLQNSNNLMAQTIFKLAGGKKVLGTGTDENAVNTFNDFYNGIGLDTKSIIVKDGCGVSRNNLINVDWMTESLNKIYLRDKDSEFISQMAQSGDGTLSNRLYNLRGNVWLKTGSLSNISGITGYIKSLDGNVYSFALLIQNFKEPQADVKAFEDEIIKLIYRR